MGGAAVISQGKSRIVIVDDHPVVRGGLIRLLHQEVDLECCGEAGSAKETEACIAAQKPDLVILDLRLRGSDSLELIKFLVSRFAGLRILVFSQYDTPVYVERVLRAGAMGYVHKEQPAEELLAAIRTVLAGEVYLTRAMAGLLLHKLVGASHQATRTGLERLTDRELHVMRLLGSGLSTRAIAEQMNLSFKTIETHREKIKLKLGLKNAAELVHFATVWAGEHVSLPPKSNTPPTGPEGQPSSTI